MIGEVCREYFQRSPDERLTVEVVPCPGGEEVGETFKPTKTQKKHFERRGVTKTEKGER